MAREYVVPGGPIVDQEGRLTPAGRDYVSAIQVIVGAVNDITNLDGATSYSNDDLRDKIIEILTALQGDE